MGQVFNRHQVVVAGKTLSGPFLLGFPRPRASALKQDCIVTVREGVGELVQNSAAKETESAEGQGNRKTVGIKGRVDSRAWEWPLTLVEIG